MKNARGFGWAALHTGLFALVLALASVAASAQEAPVQGGVTFPEGMAAQPNPLGALPASFAGDLPCADCPGIRYQLDLFPDNVFYLRTTWLGQEPARSLDDVGRWAFAANGRALILRGGREATHSFEIKGASTLRKLDPEGRAIDSGLNYKLQRQTEFTPIEPRLLLRGLYRYIADAGSFQECLTTWRLPVAREGDNARLESEYGRYSGAHGQYVAASVDGRIVMYPAMEGGELKRALVVDRFVRLWPGETCGTPFVNADLANTYWRLTLLRDNPVQPVPNMREAHLMLHPDGRLGGSAGCNQLAGTYRVEGETIRIGRAASTMMACPEPAMSTERAFVEVLEKAARWQVDGSHLELFDGAGTPLARFEATYLR